MIERARTIRLLRDAAEEYALLRRRAHTAEDHALWAEMERDCNALADRMQAAIDEVRGALAVINASVTP